MRPQRFRQGMVLPRQDEHLNCERFTTFRLMSSCFDSAAHLRRKHCKALNATAQGIRDCKMAVTHQEQNAIITSASLSDCSSFSAAAIASAAVWCASLTASTTGAQSGMPGASPLSWADEVEHMLLTSIDIAFH